MNIEVTPAASRFDRTAFSNESVAGQALPLTATYTCPRCGERVGFTKSNLEDRARQQASNLRHSVQRSFNQWASENNRVGNPFLDWACPGCGLAVRVYARAWAGGRHGDSGVDLDVVLEAEQAAHEGAV